jgi:hypothetical protein
MSAIATFPAGDLTTGHDAARHFLSDVWVLTKRSIARIRREPETLSEVTIQPVMFVLMFDGAAIQRGAQHANPSHSSPGPAGSGARSGARRHHDGLLERLGQQQ